jgi:hypothetical protein
MQGGDQESLIFFLLMASKVRYDATLVSTTVTNFPLLEGAMEAFHLWKIQCSGLRPLLYPYWCKTKMIMSAIQVLFSYLE